MILVVCSCGDLIKLEGDIVLDSGTTLRCPYGDHEVIVDIFTPEFRAELYEGYEERRKNGR